MNEVYDDVQCELQMEETVLSVGAFGEQICHGVELVCFVEMVLSPTKDINSLRHVMRHALKLRAMSMQHRQNE